MDDNLPLEYFIIMMRLRRDNIDLIMPLPATYMAAR